MRHGSWDDRAELVSVQGGLPDSTIKLWGYLASPVVDQDANSYLRLEVRPTRTDVPLIVVLVVLKRDLSRQARRELSPGVIVVAEGHHLGTARTEIDQLPVPAFSGTAGAALQVLPRDGAGAGSPLDGLHPEVRLYGVLEPGAEPPALEDETVHFVVRPYTVYRGLLPPATPVVYSGERAAHFYERITARPHLDVIGSAQASPDARYAWRVQARSVVTGALTPLG